jgi:hypothetical protein
VIEAPKHIGSKFFSSLASVLITYRKKYGRN